MGGTVSSHTSQTPQQQQQQQDLRFLAERFPFGDDEFVHLYRAYHAILREACSTSAEVSKSESSTDHDAGAGAPVATATTTKTTTTTTTTPTKPQGSFLMDWGVHCYQTSNGIQPTRLDQDDTTTASSSLSPSQQRAAMIAIMEKDILPPQFGLCWYQAAFVVPGDVPMYSSSSSSSNGSTRSNNHGSTSATTIVDEYTRKARLERFFEGISASGRRGAKDSLGVLFAIAQRLENLEQQQQPQPASSSSAAAPCDGPLESLSLPSVRARTVVETAYRVALAAAFLQAYDHEVASNLAQPSQQSLNDNHQEQQDEQESQWLLDPFQFVPLLTTSIAAPSSESSLSTMEQTSMLDPNDQQTLQALADAIVQRSQRRRQEEAMMTGKSAMGDNNNNNNNSSSVEDKQRITLRDLLDWANDVGTVFGSALPTFSFRIFFPGQPYPPSRTALDFPWQFGQSVTTTTMVDHHRHGSKLTNRSNTSSSSGSDVGNDSSHHSATSNLNSIDGKSSPGASVLSSSFFFSKTTSPLYFTFASLSSACNGPYYRLYTSESDGLSFNRLLNALLGYSGPTLILIGCGSNNMLGAYTASPWKESKDFYGNSESFLFQVQPVTAIYRPTGNGQNFQYCNPASRSRGYDQQAHGIGFGGTIDQPRLFLSESLDSCSASSRDLTYENGHLVGTSTNTGVGVRSSAGTIRQFEVDALEVYGVGGTVQIVLDALQAQHRARAIRDEGIQRARKVDKAAFLDDLRSGAVESKAFAYRQQIDGRADYDVNERNAQHQYVYETNKK